MSRTRWGTVSVAMVLLFAWGCGSGAPPVSSSMEEATVKGTVKLHGKPATKGEIVFNPGNVERKVMPRTAPIEKDGAYTVKTLVDENVVSVQGKGIDRGLMGITQTVIVKPGENTIDIEIPPPAQSQ